MFKLVYTGPSEFKTLLYRVVIVGIIVVAGFNFGSRFYLYSATKFSRTVPLKNFASIYEPSTQRDLELEVDGRKIILTSDEFKSWIEPYTRAYSGEEDLRFSFKVYDYLLQLAAQTNIEPVSAKFEFEGNKALVFSESVQGKRFDIAKSMTAIADALKTSKTSVQLVIETVEPEITLEKINDLGISTLLAKGESNFADSPSSRVHNLQLGASKYNGLIIKPGEEFSFR